MMMRAMLTRLFPPRQQVLPPPPLHANDRDAAAATLVYMIYFTMLAFMAFCLFVVLRFLMPPPTKGPDECDPDRANQCGEGEVCERGRCVADEASYCEDGASCDSCTCELPRSCQVGNVCVRPALRPTGCSADMVTLIAELLAFEKDCMASAGGVKLSNCEAKDLNKFLLRKENFEALLKNLPSGVIVVFPDRRPGLTESGEMDTQEARQWLDDTTRDRYVDAIKAEAKVFREAKHIFLIGRGGTVVSNINSSYAKVRVNFARERILDGIAKDNVEREEQGKKFVEFAIGGDKPMNLEFFSMYNYPLATWSEETSMTISAAVQQAQGNNRASARQRKEVETIINRSVIAFAVPAECVQGK